MEVLHEKARQELILKREFQIASFIHVWLLHRLEI
jgi:hypothetical protein